MTLRLHNVSTTGEDPEGFERRAVDEPNDTTD